jgi:hypothetical protein
MAANAVAFNQNLCSWGAKVQATADLSFIFIGSGCSNTSDPVLHVHEGDGSFLSGPWCENCDSYAMISHPM